MHSCTDACSWEHSDDVKDHASSVSRQLGLIAKVRSGPRTAWQHVPRAILASQFTGSSCGSLTHTREQDLFTAKADLDVDHNGWYVHLGLELAVGAAELLPSDHDTQPIQDMVGPADEVSLCSLTKRWMGGACTCDTAAVCWLDHAAL